MVRRLPLLVGETPAKLLQQLKDTFGLRMTWELGVLRLKFRVEDGGYELHRKVRWFLFFGGRGACGAKSGVLGGGGGGAHVCYSLPSHMG